MSAWIIYNKDGLAKCEARKLEYSGEFLGACSVNVRVSSPSPIGFELGDWLEYRGERFELNYDPSVVKEASSGAYGEGFVYENVVFNSLSDELTRCDFLDVVPADNHIHYTSLPNFSFFAENVEALAERLQANLDRVYKGDKSWKVSVHPEFSGKTDINVVINNQTCWDALALAKSEFEANFIIKGRTITIGTSGIAVGNLFSYGRGNGLFKIEKNAESDQKIITRLRAYGSTRNLPTHYYQNLEGGNVPNNMAVKHLMLPSFPLETLDPYIDSKNIDALGVRESTVFFDGSNGLDEIYPTMEGMTAEDLKDAGVNVSATGALDVIVTAEQMTDNGIIPEDGELNGNFKVTLKDIGFDINEHLSTSGSATLAMKSGMCSGREFEIETCVKTTDGYELTCKRTEDSGLGLVFPYKDFQIKANDKFVLLNIEMPDVYIKAASQRLLSAAKDYLAKNDYVRYSYTPTLDNIFLARQHDEAVANGGVSIHDTIKEGDFILFEDEDLGISGSVTIDSLSIKEDYSESIIPEYALTLRNEKSVGTIEKIQNQVTSILNGVSGGNVNTEQVKSIVEAVGNVRFLSKIKDDRSKGVIASDKGFEAGRFVSGFLGGTGAWIGADGYGEMSGLTLREFLEVPELRFNRIDVVSGELWNAIAFGMVEEVDTENRICKIKLEENERCGLHVGDFCRGIFADFGDGNNWEGEDECGFMHLYGFWTSYFTPTKILDNEEGLFRFEYELKPGTTQHPTQSMKFAVYGHPTDKSRQASAYATRTYKRYLNNVDTWVIDPDRHIYAQYGDLNGLQINGVNMQGYGSFQSNAYFRGVQIQLPPEQMESLKGDSAYAAQLTSYVGTVKLDADGNMAGGMFEELNVIADGKNVICRDIEQPQTFRNVTTKNYRLTTTVQAYKGTTPLYYSADAVTKGSFTLALACVGCTASVVNGAIIINSITDTEDCRINITVNCEGMAVYNLEYNVTFVQNGKIGADGKDGEDGKNGADAVSYRIEPNIQTISKTMTGTLSPESVKFKLQANKGGVINYYPTLWSLKGRNLANGEWTTLKSADGVTSFDVVFTANYKYYELSAKTYGDGDVMLGDTLNISIVADGKDGDPGERGASGAMPRYRGEFVFNNESEPYVYDGEYRDIVIYDGNVYQVYMYGSSIIEPPSIAPNADNDGKWQRANKFRFVAMDTALIDNANIAGFTFARKKYINGAPVGVMRSQYGPICVHSVSSSVFDGSQISVTINRTLTKYIKIQKFKNTAYSLVPSVKKVVRRKNNNGEWVYDVNFVSCNIKKITASATTTLSYVEGYTLRYSIDSGTEVNGNTTTTSGASESIKYVLYDTNGVEVAQHTIPVLSDGDDTVKAVFDNESVPLLVNTNEEVLSGLPHRLMVTLWKGANEISITDFSTSSVPGVEVVNERVEIDTETGTLKCTNAVVTGEVNATSGVFKNIMSPNGHFKIDDSGRVEILGTIETSMEGKRIVINPETQSIEMYDDLGRKTASMSFKQQSGEGWTYGEIDLFRYTDESDTAYWTARLNASRVEMLLEYPNLSSYEHMIIDSLGISGTNHWSGKDYNFKYGFANTYSGLNKSGYLANIYSDCWPTSSQVGKNAVYLDGGTLKVKQ